MVVLVVAEELEGELAMEVVQAVDFEVVLVVEKGRLFKPHRIKV